MNFNRVCHYKPSILGYPYFWKHPYIYIYSIYIYTWTFHFGCPGWFSYRVSIHHPLGLNWHSDWKVQAHIMFVGSKGLHVTTPSPLPPTYVVDGSEILRSPVEVGSLSHYLQGFTTPKFNIAPKKKIFQ